MGLLRFFKWLRFFRRRFHKHDFKLEKIFRPPAIIQLPVWGERLESVVLICKCGERCVFDVGHDIHHIDWRGTRLSEKAGHPHSRQKHV